MMTSPRIHIAAAILAIIVVTFAATLAAGMIGA